MRPKDEADTKVQSATFILSEKIDDTKSKKSEKEMKKEMRRLAREQMEKEKKELKAKEKEKERQKEREKQAKKGKVVCGACGGKCSGEVLRVSDKYFHTACFTCRACAASLAKGGFFAKDKFYYCPQDYQRLFGTRCAACGQYVEGEVVAALGNTYHQKCFTCARCGRAFPSGEKVTYTGSEVVCMQCAAPSRTTARARAAEPEPPQRAAKHVPIENGNGNASDRPVNENECAGCGEELSEGQALVALDRQWHAGCFRCSACGSVLRGEYMARGGAAYCERDYQRLHGVRCAYCGRYIAGKVLQAGDQHHFHPTCARCCKCGDAFGDGEEMFLQGAAVWHPRCGPAPHRADSLSRSRTPSVSGSYCSPYASLSKSALCSVGAEASGRSSRGACSPLRFAAAYSYLGSSEGGLRRPLQPAPPASPHFHRPPSGGSTRASSRAGSRQSSRGAVAALADTLRSDSRARSPPPLNNEEPIELSTYPAAFKPPPGVPSKIERDDFPAPPYAYTDPERRRRLSSSRGAASSDDDDDDDVDAAPRNGHEPRLAREHRELAKIDTGMAQVFLKEVKEREKLQQWKKHNLDPRNASRTPSASAEAVSRLRYSSPVGASPSRVADRAPLDSLSCDHAPPPAHHYAVVSSLRAAPRPGYGLAPRSHTFSSTAGDFTFSGLGDKTHSTDFSSGKSDISAGSITDVDRSAVTEELVVARGRSALQAAPRGTHSSHAGHVGHAGHAGHGGHLGHGVRRSLPNMVTSALLHEPAKLYPYHLLLISNYRLPPDVDRLNLERHLSDAEFEAILQVARHEFYRLPQWRRNELKRRARLF